LCYIDLIKHETEHAASYEIVLGDNYKKAQPITYIRAYQT